MTSANSVVAGTVILYECDEEVIVNLATYANDLDLLVVVDNSASRNPAVAAAVAAHADAAYFFNDGNMGVAAALNLAADWARARSADFLLTMDQDSGFYEVPFRLFRNQVLSLPHLADIAIAAPCIREGGPRSAESVVVDSRTVITSGSLVNLTNYARIGPFDERLFIDEVDLDYCLRAKDAGLRVVTLPTIPLRHRLGQPRTISILGKAISWKAHSPSRHYYMVRNGLYMFSKHRKAHLGYCLRRLCSLTRTVAAAVILGPQRREQFGKVVQGIHDFRTMRMGAADDVGPKANAANRLETSQGTH